MNIHINEFCLEEGQQFQILVPISIQAEKSSEVSSFLFIRVWLPRQNTAAGTIAQSLDDSYSTSETSGLSQLKVTSLQFTIPELELETSGWPRVFVKSVLQCRVKWHQRDLEWFGLEGMLKVHLVQPLQWAGTPATMPGCSKPDPNWPQFLWAICAMASHYS